jgi:hypothetical protein
MGIIRLTWTSKKSMFPWKNNNNCLSIYWLTTLTNLINSWPAKLWWNCHHNCEVHCNGKAMSHQNLSSHRPQWTVALRAWVYIVMGSTSKQVPTTHALRKGRDIILSLKCWIISKHLNQIDLMKSHDFL